MNASKIRDLTEEELEQTLLDTRKELFNLRVQQATGQLENQSRLQDLRRDVARINTVLTERGKAEG